MDTNDDLKVVDVNLALDMMGGNEQIFLKVIDSFLESQSNLIVNISNSLHNDMNEARRLVHSCKGISQNIGSLKLYDVASAFETAILGNEKALVEHYFSEFEAVFHQVFHELKKIKLNVMD